MLDTNVISQIRSASSCRIPLEQEQLFCRALFPKIVEELRVKWDEEEIEIELFVSIKELESWERAGDWRSQMDHKIERGKPRRREKESIDSYG